MLKELEHQKKLRMRDMLKNDCDDHKRLHEYEARLREHKRDDTGKLIGEYDYH